MPLLRRGKETLPFADAKGNLAVIGLFHLGSVFSIGFSSLGYQVLGLDPDRKIISKLQKNEIPLYEPGLDKLLSKNKKYISFATDFSKLSQISTVFFTQDTETDGSGSVEKLEQMIDLSLPYFKQNVTITIVSQVPVGFHRNLQDHIKSKRPDLKFTLFHWVDTIVMTTALERFLIPERIILGKQISDEKINSQLKSILNEFSCPVFEMSYESAEITKAAINLYLATSVTFANTLADFCENFGGNIYDIIPALKSDKRIGNYSYINPSLRIAGGHLERDLFMLNRLAEGKKISSGIVSKIIDENEKRFLWVDKQLKIISKNQQINKISLWGLSYKKNSTSTENAPSIKIISRFQNRYSISAYDPLAIVPSSLKLKLNRIKDKYTALKNSEVLILMTDWDEFKDIDFQRIGRLMKNKTIIDCVGLFSKIKQPEGFKVVRLGVN